MSVFENQMKGSMKMRVGRFSCTLITVFFIFAFTFPQVSFSATSDIRHAENAERCQKSVYSKAIQQDSDWKDNLRELKPLH